MTNKYTKYNNKKQENQEQATTKITFHKDNVIVESKEALLVQTSEGAVWLNKKGMFDSKYTNILTKFVIDEFDFDIINTTTNKVLKTVKGKDLPKIM